MAPALVSSSLVQRLNPAVARLLVLVLWLSLWATAEGSEGRRKNYTLPADDAPQALTKFAEQSGEQVIYLLNQVKGVRTNPVNGRFTAREAIERLIADTVLRVVADQPTGAFMIQRIEEPARPETPKKAAENEKRSEIPPPTR
jgi:iron complex outermembrane receptor protein